MNIAQILLYKNNNEYCTYLGSWIWEMHEIFSKTKSAEVSLWFEDIPTLFLILFSHKQRI